MNAVLLTCAGQRVDIVTAFGRAGAETIAADVNPLAHRNVDPPANLLPVFTIGGDEALE